MTHKHKPFASSGDSETDELSGDNKPDSGDNADLAIPKRLRASWKHGNRFSTNLITQTLQLFAFYFNVSYMLQSFLLIPNLILSGHWQW